MYDEFIYDFFQKDGDLASVIDDYEYREEQIKASLKIKDAIENGKILLLEAPTGIGKSFAYLVPSIVFARESGKKVIVSTATINLQTQIVKKDIPSLEKALSGYDFKTEIALGRKNYICIYKYFSINDSKSIQEDLFGDSELKQMDLIGRWLETTETGIREELESMGKIYESVWEEVASDGDSCKGKACPYYDRCFYKKSRERLQEADIIITNHALMLTDLFAGEDSEILPDYDTIIVDEAHNLEESAVRTLEMIAGWKATLKEFFRLIRSEKGKRKGYIELALRYLEKEMRQPASETAFKTMNQVKMILTGIESAVPEATAKVEETFSKTFEKFLSLRGKDTEDGISGSIDEMLDEESANSMVDLGIYLKNKIADPLLFAVKLLDNLPSIHSEPLTVPRNGLKKEADRFTAVSETLSSLRETENDNLVRWLEANFKKRDILVHLTPITGAEFLRRELFEKKRSVCLVSATLTVGGSFEFVKKITFLGDIPDKEVEEVSLPTPFDFKNAVEFFVVKNLPEPTDENFTDESARVIKQIIRESKGGTLVLFTSGKMMKQVYENVVKNLKNHRVLIQGEFSRSYLLEQFRKDENSSLFAVKSFWEGIDVKGESLRTLIIVRLPFSPPDSPVERERANVFGGFKGYSLPVAVLKFKQGFGRLIRHREDKGRIFVLDKRLITRSYGKVFLRSLPEMEVRIIEIQENSYVQ